MDLLCKLRSLPDPRDEQKISFPLSDLIFMAVCAVLKEIEKVFSTWSQSLTIKPSQQIVIDGKALRGTASAQKGLTCLNFVSAWCHNNGIVLSQIATEAIVAEAPSGFQKMGWSKLSSIVAIETISSNLTPNVTTEWRYYVTSLSATDVAIPTCIRNHWSIENNLRWILDVHMGDDANRSQERNATLAMAALKRVAVNIIKTYDTQNKSIRRKLKHSY